MKVRITDDFDLKKIAESGQCFRWRALDGEGYRILAGDRILTIRQAAGENNVYDVSCGQEEWDHFWRKYFDLDTCYARIRKLVSREKDPYLWSAAQAGKGIRILRQDPFETLISFIISQRKSIPAIRTCIEKLCQRAGEILTDDTGAEFYAFPSKEALAGLSKEQIASCGAGYRTKYLSGTAGIIAKNEKWPGTPEGSEDDTLRAELMKLPGVGVKVADCVMLFGFHRMNAFPKDVWVNRVLSEHYPEGFSFQQYAPYCGLMQQYLFYFRRQQAG